MTRTRNIVVAAGLISGLGLMSQIADARQTPQTWFAYDHASGHCEQTPADFTPASVKAELAKNGTPSVEKKITYKNGELAMLAVVNSSNGDGMAFFTSMSACNVIAQKDPAMVGKDK